MEKDWIGLLFKFHQLLVAISGSVYRSTWEALNYLHLNTANLINGDEPKITSNLT